MSRGSCKECGSSDGVYTYPSGQTHCFVCEHHTWPDKEGTKVESELMFPDKIYTPGRGISQKTAEFFGYFNALFKIVIFKCCFISTSISVVLICCKKFTVGMSSFYY